MKAMRMAVIIAAVPSAPSSAHPLAAKTRLNPPFPSFFSYLSLDRSTCLPASRSASKRKRGPPAFVLNSAKFLPGNSMKRGEEDDSRRRFVLFLIALASSTSFSPSLASYGKTKGKNNPYDEKRLMEQNRRIQRENKAPEDFPSFIREGFDVKVVTSENYVRRDSGLIYKDFEVGAGDCPVSGQQVIFHYVGYNESGRRIDSTYLQGSPAKVRMGTNSLIPGTTRFEEGIRDMKPGGKRRIVIPPELGPPVGPSTFFSSKQFEVFDVELLDIQNCQRRTIGFYSDVVCN